MIGFLGLCIAVISILFTMYYNLMDREMSRKEYIDELRAGHPRIFSEIYKNCLEKGLDKLEGWFGAPCSTRALTLNTAFAILYTISFFFISWVAGQNGKIGTISVLSESVPTIGRILIVLILILTFVISYGHKKIDTSVQRLLAKKMPSKVAYLTYRLPAVLLILGISLFSGGYFFLLFILFVLYSPAGAGAIASAVIVAVAGADTNTNSAAYAFAFAFAVVYVIAGAGEVALAVVFELLFVVAFAFAFIVTFAVPFAFIVTVTFVFTFAFAFIVTGTKKKFLCLYSCFVFTMALLFIGLSLEVKFLELNSDLVSYLFFIIILPFINGYVDFVSFGISRFLGRKILKDRTVKAFLWHFTIDFAAAVILLGLLVFGICFGVELFNNLVVKRPDLMIDLPRLIADAKKAPFGPDGLWITLMLFSTLVPTFAHFVIAFTGVYTIYLTPRILRQKIADVLEENRSKRSQILPIFYFSMRPLLSILFAIGFWWIVGYTINKYIIHYTNILYKIAYWGIDLADVVLI